MIGAKNKYGSVQNAMNTWRDYMVSMGFGYKLGIDLPGEKRGLIPNAEFYDKAYKGSWNGLTIISIAIGQGVGRNSVALLPSLQGAADYRYREVAIQRAAIRII